MHVIVRDECQRIVFADQTVVFCRSITRITQWMASITIWAVFADITRWKTLARVGRADGAAALGGADLCARRLCRAACCIIYINCLLFNSIKIVIFQISDDPLSID